MTSSSAPTGPPPESPPPPTLEVRLLRLDPGLPLPSYAHDGDAGADLHAAVDVELAPFERVLVPTGIAIELPVGHVGLVHPRSGLAVRHGLTVLNTPGTIDAGYRGEISVLLVNLDPREPVRLRRGDRVAQLVVQRVERAHFVEVSCVGETARGSGGYGSTGGFAAPEDGTGTGRRPEQEPPPDPATPLDPTGEVR